MERIDAMGKNCPQPVMMTKAAVDKGAGELEVLVDNEVAVSNVEKFLRSRGYETTRSGASGQFSVRGKKTGEQGGVPFCCQDAHGRGPPLSILLLHN